MMSNFNFIEKKISHFLDKFPHAKKVIKHTYQNMSYFLTWSKPESFSCFPYKRISYLDQESFFGYYDKSPINTSGTKILFHSTKYPTKKLPDIQNPISICLLDVLTNNITEIDKTSAYNWQQGCRLQWLDDRRFIYNFFDDKSNTYSAKIYSIANNTNVLIPYPVYDCFDNSAVTIDFERLYLLNPDYGYRPIKRKNKYNNISNDGIYLININDNTIKLVLSYSDIIDTHSKASMKNAVHKINHLMFSPNGNSIIFLHRWYFNNIKYDALMHYDLISNKCKCLSDDDMVSHCCWNDNHEIISWLRKKGEGDKYYTISITDSKYNELDPAINLGGDGHPSIHGNLMLFDTYPDKTRMKKLFIYNLNNKDLKQIGSFFDPLEYYDMIRCDLHPKWAADGKSIFVDSVHDGKRYLYKIEFENKID